MAGSIKPTRGTRRRGAALLALAAALLSAPVAWALGELSQKPGTAGCVSENGTGGLCQNGKALENATGVATSPDGRNVYVASVSSDAVAVFDREPATGALTQKPGTAGCLSEDGTGGLCQNGTALDGAAHVVVSVDGKSVYVTSDPSDAVAILDRDTGTGALSQKPGTAGCVSADGSGGACQNGTALNHPLGVTASPDGKSVYVASGESDAVAIFDRNPATGALSQKPGTAGCISGDGSGGACQQGTALRGAAGVTASPHGESVYVASVSPDAVAIFDRNRVTGALTQKPGTAGCISADGSGGACQNGPDLADPWFVTASPDGTSVYVTFTSSDAVAVFDRDPTTGALARKPGTASCVSEDGTGGLCQDGTALDGAFGIAASPDGSSVYVASFLSDALAVFDRDPATGELTQKPGLACVSETGTGACQDGTALDAAFGVAASPDAHSVYVSSQLSSAVAIFDRATPSSPPPPPPPPDTLAPTVTDVAFAPRRFRAASSATPTDARAATARRAALRGSRLRLTLSELADARIAIERAHPGRRVGGRCKRPSRKLRKRRQCARYKPTGTLTRRSLPAGDNAIRFSGRIGKRALAPGHYRATVTATDPVGNRSRPTRATFTIVRR